MTRCPYDDGMNRHLTPRDLDRLARTIDREHIDAVPAATIHTLADQARRAGASSTLTSLIVDPSEPMVARERAFLHLGARLLRFPAAA